MVSGGRSMAVLVNPSAGGGRALKRAPAVASALEERRIEFRVEHTRSAEHGVEAALQAAERGEVPVVMSGDGLIGAVGGALAGSDTALGILPGGRGNDLARALGIPDDPVSAVDVLVEGKVRRIDVGEANGRRFLCIASAGFESDANRIANEMRFVRGNLVYAIAAVRALIAWRPARFTVRVDGRTTSFSGYSVSAANSRAYGGGMFVAPDADIADGQLDVVMIGEGGRLRFLFNLPKVFKGSHVENDEVHVVRGERVELSADRPFEVYADGEHLTDLPATVRVLPRALGVIAPAES